MPFTHKSFYFLRHGETDWNRQQRIMGQSDIPLNKTGVLQAKTVAEKIQVLAIDAIVTSPLKRAYETAEIIGNKIRQPVFIENDLQEFCWGVMEGKVKGDCSYKDTPFEPEKWWKQGIVPTGAEAFSEFVSRAVKATNYHLPLYQSILFVAHGGIIMAILAAISKPPQRVDNTALFHFTPPDLGKTSWDVNIIN
jgi:broad specificity phosphatase PhoE